MDLNIVEVALVQDLAELSLCAQLDMVLVIRLAKASSVESSC